MGRSNPSLQRTTETLWIWRCKKSVPLISCRRTCCKKQAFRLFAVRAHDAPSAVLAGRADGEKKRAVFDDLMYLAVKLQLNHAGSDSEHGAVCNDLTLQQAYLASLPYA